MDYENARDVIATHFDKVERLHLVGKVPTIPPEIEKACGVVFSSNTQAYREVLLGCVLVKLTNPSINIRQPYVEQGDNAFSGRTLDERVVNRFLHDKQIPCSRGPYLSVFRRNVRFDVSTRGGLRDKDGYDAFLAILSYLENQTSHAEVNNLLDYVLYSFVSLREAANIQIARLPRISFAQYGALIAGLLAIPSGGRIPVILVVAMLQTMKGVFKLDWEIEYAGINVADAAAGASGDITVSTGGKPLMIVEVTERPVESSRVQSTFRTKIATSGVLDYLFLVNIKNVSPEAFDEASKYFAQGYEVNFVDVGTWVLMCLATIGASGRSQYNTCLTELFEGPDLPNTVKTGWNDEVLKLTAG